MDLKKITVLLIVITISLGILEARNINANGIGVNDSIQLSGKWIRGFGNDSLVGNESDEVLPAQGAVKKYGQILLSKNNLVSITKFGAVPNDGKSDRKAIQKTLNWVSKNGGICYIPKGKFDLDSTLTIYSNTAIYANNAGKIWLMDSTNTEIMRNEHAKYSGATQIADSNITMIGGHWYGNGNNQNNRDARGPKLRAFVFNGVKNLILRDLTIHLTASYALHLSYV
jgi:polygalacturonase